MERLNQRPGPTPPSTLDAISSSTEQQQAPRNGVTVGHQQRPSLPARRPPPTPNAHDDPDPPDTSSESGSNDSFTCSEFESENDNKIRNDLSSRLKYPRRHGHHDNGAGNGTGNRSTPTTHAPDTTTTDHEDTDVSRTLTKSPGSDSNRDSLSAFFTSEDELPKTPAAAASANKLLNGGLNLDYLLNWGPNFSKLVGVFQDIAQLPDTQQGPGQLGGMVTPSKSPVGGRTVSPFSAARPPSRTKSPHRTKSPRARGATSPLGRAMSPLAGGGTTSPVARNTSPLGRSPLTVRPPSRQQPHPPQPPPRPHSVLRVHSPPPHPNPNPSPLPHPGVSPIPHIVADSQPPNHVTVNDADSLRGDEDGSRSPLHDSVQDSREEYV